MGWRRTTFALVLIFYTIRRGAAEFFDAVWVSPEEGTVYKHADTIVGKWSFKLCEVMKESVFEGRGQDGEESPRCGAPIWLQPQELEDGALITITVPATLQESEYRLEMQDNLGNVFTSPIFGLGFPPGDKISKSAGPSSDSTEFSGSQENPAGTPTGKVSGSPTNTSEMGKHSLASKPSGSSGLVAPAPATITSPRIRVPSSSSTPPEVPVSRRPVPIAAFAVPLSAVSGIIIVAGLLFLNNRRKLAKEKGREFKTLILSKLIRDSEEYGSVKEVQPTMSVLSHKGFSGYYDASEPLPVSFPRPEARVATHNPFAPMGNYSSSSTIFDDGLGYYYGEEPTVTRGKSLTDQYTAAGTKLRSEDCTQATPSGFLPARMSPVHVRSHSPEGIHSLPLPPAPSTLSMMDLGDAFRILTDEVKRS